MNPPKLQFYQLHYQQVCYLKSLFEEAENFNQKFVSYELHDDGSPKHTQDAVAEIASCHPNLKVVLHEKNRGLFAMLNGCLKASDSPYTYIGAGDDMICSAAMHNALQHVHSTEKMPIIITDFYVMHMESRTSVYAEAILPRECMTGNHITSVKFKDALGRNQIFIVTTAALIPTQAARSTGSFLERMKWYSDWFSCHVAALRNGVQYIPIPLGCWRHDPSKSYSRTDVRVREEKDVLRNILSTLKTPEYDDVREILLTPNATPVFDGIACRLLFAILFRPQYWGFLRRSHFYFALHEIAAPWISPERWGGRMLIWLDKNSVLRFLWQPFMRLLLRLGGAHVGRNVRFGRNMKIREPRGLRIGDNVIIGNDVNICAIHPLNIASGVRIGNQVRLESANSSTVPGVRFFRKKTVTIGRDAFIDDHCSLGPGANIPAGEHVPGSTQIENVESAPLFFLDDTDQIRVDYKVLREWYGLDPKGNPVVDQMERQPDISETL